MPEVELARRPDVELVRTGRFQTLTGSWNPTPGDIKAAVDAMECPAIRKPVIRIGHTDKRFQVSGDGEPALGWFENLRAADGGHTLVADQVTLPWLHSVQAAAYPSRSIEGNYNHRCSEGHVHPFVIHTVALLGVTPPGVQTLRSLNDLPEMLGVAASGEVPDGAQHVQVTVMAAAEVHTGAMVALIPTVEDAERLAVEGGEPADQLHVTLAYLGEAADLGAQGQQDVIDSVSSAANGLPEVVADLFSVNIFNPPGMPSEDGRDRDTCLVWGISGDLIDAVHTVVSEALWSVPTPQQHQPWHCHMTAAYTDDLGRIGELATKVGPVKFDRLRLAFAGQHVDIPLIGEPDALDDTPDEVAAAAGDSELRDYWLHGEGLKRWADAKHPWTTLYRLIKKHVGNADKARRIASDWYRDHFGHMPNQKVKAGHHSFDESKIKRDGDGQFADKAGVSNGSDSGSGGNASKAPTADSTAPKPAPSRIGTDEKIAARVKLGDGETVTGSASIKSAGIMAVTSDTKDGPRLRLGFVGDADEQADWDGTEDTAVLDEKGAAEVHAGVGEMLAAGEEGQAQYKALEKHLHGLEAAERKLIYKQYPNLSAADKKTIDKVDSRLDEIGSKVDDRQPKQVDRLTRIPDGLRPKVEAFEAQISKALAGGDTAEAAKIRNEQIALLRGGDDRTMAFLYGRAGQELDKLRAEGDRLRAQRNQLTGDPQPLSDGDQAALAKVRADLDAVFPEFDEFDGAVIARGVARGERGDVHWEAQMTIEGNVSYAIGVGPTFDTDPGWSLADSNQDHDISADDLRKLNDLLSKVGGPEVKASESSAPAGGCPGEPASPILPAAEPEPVNTDPKEDLVSTELSGLRSRLGLSDDADLDAITAKVDELKTKAEAPAEPTPEMVQASQAAVEKATKAEEAQDLLKGELTRLSGELATIKASAAQTVKASFFQGLKDNGRLKPADEESWSARYDRDPEMVTEILSTRAPNSEVPVMASGSTGSPEPVGTDNEWDEIVSRLDAPKAV